MAENPFDVFEEHAALTERQKKLKAEEEQFGDQIRESWRWMLEDERGRRLMWFLLSRCGVHNISFTGQAMSTAFNEGRRDVGCWAINQILKTDPTAYVRMLAEHDNDRRERADRDRRSHGRRGGD